MWQLDRDATKASSGSTPAGSDCGTGTTWARRSPSLRRRRRSGSGGACCTGCRGIRARRDARGLAPCNGPWRSLREIKAASVARAAVLVHHQQFCYPWAALELLPEALERLAVDAVLVAIVRFFFSRPSMSKSGLMLSTVSTRM